MTLPKLHATAVDCAYELINRESGVKGKTGKIPKINNGECWIMLRRVAKNGLINKLEVPLFETRE